MLVFLISIFGGLGAVARFILDGHIRSKVNADFPWATLIINAAGSFILGCIAGIALHHHDVIDMKLIVGTGFCGGFTTFSAACFESARLVEEKKYIAFWLQVLGNLLSSLLAAMLGLMILF